MNFIYVLVFVSGENLTPVGYFTTLNSCLYDASDAVFVENGEPTKNPLAYLCVRVELPLN